MLSTNALSVYTPQHKQNEICEQNLRSIQEAMSSDDPTGSKLKLVSTEFPIPEILTKSATPGEIPETYPYEFVGKNPLGKTITAFS